MKNMTRIFLSSIFVFISFVTICVSNKVEIVNAESNDLKLVYQLNFDDDSNLGNNSIDNDYADATVYRTGDHMVQVDRDGGKAIMIDGATSFENYLNLPTNFFEGQTEATISGWFYLDSTAESYSGEIGIFSPENDKAFRTDSHAYYHGGHYIFVLGNDQWFDSGIFPVYDGWYHMAYVFSGNRLEVYQNGHLVGSRDSNQFSSVSQLHSATSHFYLGQSAYETNHPDYKGGFDDVRIYQKALTSEQISSEYDFDMFDFMTNQYTFDTEETMYNDSVRGYDLDPHGADDKAYGPSSWPTFDDGAMKIDGNSMVVVSRNGNHDQTGQPTRVNPTYLSGMSEVSFSMDVKFDSNTGFNWERLFDVFKAAPEGRIISFLTHQGSSNSSFDVVYRNVQGDNIRWVLGENGKQVNLVPENWYNITITSSANKLTIYVDGVEIASIDGIHSIGKLAAYNYLAETSPDVWFTLGAPIYEPDRAVAASYDNFRVFSKALTASETLVLSTDYSRATTKITLINGEEQTVVKHPSKQVYVLETLSKDNYTFVGWQDVNGNILTEVPANTGDITLTAVFEELKYKVSFDANGGRGQMAILDITDEVENLPESLFVKTGYTFAGWSTTAGGEVEILDKAAVDVITEDTILYAVWAPKQYEVSFEANGGTGSLAAITLTYDVEANLPESTLTRTGYTFAGWALTADGVVAYEDKAAVTSISEGNNVKLYAVWVLKSYKVTFEANGGTGSMAELTVDALALTKLPANSFVKEGYEFKGWAIDEEVVYQDEEVIEFESNVTLKAVWEKIEDEPTDNPSDDGPTDNPNTNKPEEKPDTNEPTPEAPSRGCFGSVVGVVGLMGMLSLLGAVFVCKKRKNN